MSNLRSPTQADWPTIATLADSSLDHVPGAPSQVEPVQNPAEFEGGRPHLVVKSDGHGADYGSWFQNRLKFKGERRHYVVERDEHIAGYGSIEKPDDDSTNGFRLFLVLRWLNQNSLNIADELLLRLRQEVQHLGIEYLWVREFADDRPLIEYLLSQGFEVTKTYEFAGHRLVNLHATKRFLGA